MKDRVLRLLIPVFALATIGACPLSATAQAPTYITHWGSSGSGPGQFIGPYGVATSATGMVYVCDQFNQRVQSFTATGSLLGAFGSQGTGPGQFRVPYNLAVGLDGSVYVTNRDDFVDARIEQFSSAGVFIREWRGSTSPGGPFSGNILGIAVEPDGDVLVSDGGTSRVCRYTPDGQFVAQIDGIASGPVLAVDRSGDFYLRQANSVVRYSPTGSELGHIDLVAGADADGIAVDGGYDIYVTDHLAHRVLRYSASGSLLATWGTFGTDPGQFDTPTGIAVDLAGNVYVSDLGNSRVQVFGDRATQSAPFTWGQVKDLYRK